MPTSRVLKLSAATSCLLTLSIILSTSFAAPNEDNGQLVKRQISVEDSPARRNVLDIPTPSPTALSKEESEQQNKLKRPEQVTVIASKFLRPNSDYHVLIQLANCQTLATIDLQLIGARDSDREQIEAKSVLAHPNETQTVKFQVGDWPAAEYVLGVNVQAVDKSWNFKDERSLTYQAKSFSGFIQTDRAIYKPGQQVQFRVLFLTQTLTPYVVKSNEINVTVEDPARNIIKQWPQLSNYRGLLTLEMPLSNDPMLGDYLIKVMAKGQEFSKQFTVAEYVLPTFEVSLQLPEYATYNESQVTATVKAIYTYGKPVKGHVTLTVQPLVRFSYISTRPLEQAQYRARLMPDGSVDFQLDLVKDLKLPRDDLFEREIEFFALVEEDLTGRKYNGSKSLKIHENKIKIERLNKETNVLKPGLSSVIRYKVAYQDDLPVENSGPKVELKYSVFNRPIQTIELRPVNGIIEHQLELPSKIADPLLDSYHSIPNSVDIEVNYRQRRHYLEAIEVQHTSSNQHIQISLPQLQSKLRQKRAANKQTGGRNEISVNDQLDIQVRTTEPIQQVDVTCQGFARGDIVWALSKRVPEALNGKNLTELEFQVKIEPKMVPQMRVLCFYVRAANKELIADSVQVDVVDRSLKNLVKITTSREEAKPGQEVEVSVLTKPNSLVGVLAIDQSTLLLKSGNDLDSKQIIDDLKSYGSTVSTDHQLTMTNAANTVDLLDGADVVVMTNNLLYDGYGPSNLVRSYSNPVAYQRMSVSRFDDGSRGISLSPLIMETAIQPPEFHLKARQNEEPIRIRTLFPETWIWQNATADSSGKAQFSARVPDTITSWQLSAFSMNEAFGLALNSGKTSVRVFKPFFIKLNLPYSIIRGEIVNIQAIIFNYSKRPMRARVTLDNSLNQLELIEASNSIGDEKILDDKESSTRLVQIPAQDGASVSFLVRPTKLGHIDIKVLARGDLVSDGVVRKLLVKAEGQTQHFNKAILMKLKKRDEGAEANVWRQNVTLEVPANAVADSQRVSVSAIGDILGAGLANPDDMLRLPYGCGEQNMVNLVPNIVILNYLKNTNRLRDLQRDRARRNIQVGYQRELNYKRLDGSFSAFGLSDANGSVWLTAYVLKTFQQARSIISVDEKVLTEAVEFLAAHSLPDGSMEEFGMLHQKDLASESLASGDGRSKGIYLTAYVMIALMEGNQQTRGSNGTTTGEVGAKMLDKGLDFLERQLNENDNRLSTYELSIIAYTLQLATTSTLNGARRQKAADRAYELLWSRAIERLDDNQVHWANVAQSRGPKAEETTVVDLSEIGASAGPVEVVDENKQDVKLRYSPRSVSKQQQVVAAPPLKEFAVKSDQSAHLFVPDSLDVEMTSWALLTAVRRNELERSLPIVRWLVAKQNSLGGFASTQDTVLAIEALASYAEASVNSLQTNGAGPLNWPEQSIEIEFVYPKAQSSSNALRRHNLDQILVSRTNSLVQQQTRLPDNITWVQIQANGVGLAVVQVSWQYNLMVSAEKPAFYLNPTLDSQSDANYLKLSVCTFYKGGEPDDKLAASNMAVAEVELPSGYVADMEALKSKTRHEPIKRIDTENGDTKVLVYLDRVTRDELCFTVPAHRSSKVSNNKPVPVSIYDYYKRSQAARVFYKPPSASSCDICEQESCGETCGRAQDSAAKLVDRPPSLHEQRARQRLELAETSGRLVMAKNSTGSNLTPANGPDIDAYKLLPLTSAFSAINQAAKNTTSLSF